MTTMAALIDTTLDVIYGVAEVERPREDTITGALNAGVTTMTVASPNLWKADAIGEFQVDGELVICAADPSGSNVTIRRNQRGTTHSGTKASGSVLVKNPPHPRSRVQRAIEQVIRLDLWPHVWSWHQDSFTYVPGDHTYPLDQYVEEVVLVHQYDLNNDERWHPIPNNRWEVERQVDAAVATNKTLLRVKEVWDADAPVYITAKRRPHVDDLTNLSDEIADLIPWSAAAKLLATRAGQTRADAARGRADNKEGFLRDYRGLMAEFLRMRQGLHVLLRDEVRTEPKFRPQFRKRF